MAAPVAGEDRSVASQEGTEPAKKRRRRRRRGGRGRAAKSNTQASQNQEADGTQGTQSAAGQEKSASRSDAGAMCIKTPGSTGPKSARSQQNRNPRPQGSRRPQPKPDAHVYAALDLGTNNCRLLVAKRARDGFRVIDAFSRIVRLGEGLAHRGHLSDEAMERALDALKICSDKMARRGVTRSRSIATEACRMAGNGADFISQVKGRTGLDLDIVSTADEAQLAVAGCAPLIDRSAEAALVFDIGGGSTELMWVTGATRRRPEIRDWTSLPCGVVTLAETYGGRDVSPESFERMVQHVTGRLQEFQRRLPDPSESVDGFHLLGTSGTVTTIAGVHLGLKRYDRSRVDGTWISPDQVSRVTGQLLDMDFEARAANSCVGAERADLVLAGCAILEAINRAWPADRLRVADRGLREGILFSLLAAEENGRRKRRRRRRRKSKAQNPQNSATNAPQTDA